MCQPSTDIDSKSDTVVAEHWYTRLHPLLVLCLLPLVPSWCFINRGFTQWFHWAAIAYLLSGWKFLEKFQTLVGVSVCVGWYSSIAYAAIRHGEFMHILYQNMPGVMTDHIFDPTTKAVNYSSSSAWGMMLLAHSLDTLGHPLLTYYFWRRHRNRGGNLADLVTWPVILSSFIYSRIWSLTHTTYNTGEPGLIYIGHDIYVVEHLDCWIPAYVAESTLHGLLVLYKLIASVEHWMSAEKSQQRQESKSITVVESSRDNLKPHLMYSESGVSKSSSMASLNEPFEEVAVAAE